MNVLALNGGGSSGYMTASLIALIEKETGESILNNVDFIAGVSTGSIIGSLLQAGYNGEEIKDIYKEFFDVVFGKKRHFLVALFKSFFKTKNLRDSLKSKLSVMRMEDCEVDFMVHALQLNKPELKPKFWKSWREDDKSTYLYDIACASSSALTAFPPYKIGENFYQDGGIFMNDPSMAAYAECIRRGVPDEDIRVLDISCDFHRGFDDAGEIEGMIKIVPKLAQLAIDGGENATRYMAKQIMGSNFLAVVPQVYLALDNNDWKEMDLTVKKLWDNNRVEIINFLKG